MKLSLRRRYRRRILSMNKGFFASGLLATCLLSGCATTELQSNTVRKVDSTQVTAVERVAKDAGVHIIWVNPPTRVRERKLKYSMTVKPKRDEDRSQGVPDRR
ncbi:MAG TPA: hypothetical protein VKO38_07365 [Wenzhouxiangella sp.]|nr:hypothetical protein [Wenzhouxiangella sp.]